MLLYENQWSLELEVLVIVFAKPPSTFVIARHHLREQKMIVFSTINIRLMLFFAFVYLSWFIFKYRLVAFDFGDIWIGKDFKRISIAARKRIIGRSWCFAIFILLLGVCVLGFVENPGDYERPSSPNLTDENLSISQNILEQLRNSDGIKKYMKKMQTIYPKESRLTPVLLASNFTLIVVFSCTFIQSQWGWFRSLKRIQVGKKVKSSYLHKVNECMRNSSLKHLDTVYSDFLIGIQKQEITSFFWNTYILPVFAKKNVDKNIVQEKHKLLIELSTLCNGKFLDASKIKKQLGQSLLLSMIQLSTLLIALFCFAISLDYAVHGRFEPLVSICITMEPELTEIHIRIPELLRK